MEEALILLFIPFLGTVIGSAFVFFMKDEMPSLLQKLLLGFAAGVMIAASVWSLIIPAMEMGATDKISQLMPTVLGFLIGIGFLLFLDYVTPHLHSGKARPEGPASHLSKSMMLILAVTIHNLPEGMSVGAVLVGDLQSNSAIPLASVLAMSIGIAIQNIPEGAIISMPMRAAGNSRMKSFLMGSASGLTEPLGGLLIVFLASLLEPALPYVLTFAAGAMMYVVVEELIPESAEGKHSNFGTIGFAIGFVLMMVLDVALG